MSDILSIIARTAADIWQNADDEHKESNPKMPRFASSLHTRVRGLLARYSESVVIKRMHNMYECIRLA